MTTTDSGSYSTTSDTAREVCDATGTNFEIGFVEAFRRGDKTYVRGTCGKPEEFRWLRRKCEELGYTYTGSVPS